MRLNVGTAYRARLPDYRRRRLGSLGELKVVYMNAGPFSVDVTSGGSERYRRTSQARHLGFVVVGTVSGPCPHFPLALLPSSILGYWDEDEEVREVWEKAVRTQEAEEKRQAIIDLFYETANLWVLCGLPPDRFPSSQTSGHVAVKMEDLNRLLTIALPFLNNLTI